MVNFASEVVKKLSDESFYVEVFKKILWQPSKKSSTIEKDDLKGINNNLTIKISMLK